MTTTENQKRWKSVPFYMVRSPNALRARCQIPELFHPNGRPKFNKQTEEGKRVWNELSTPTVREYKILIQEDDLHDQSIALHRPRKDEEIYREAKRDMYRALCMPSYTQDGKDASKAKIKAFRDAARTANAHTPSNVAPFVPPLRKNIEHHTNLRHGRRGSVARDGEAELNVKPPKMSSARKAEAYYERTNKGRKRGVQLNGTHGEYTDDDDLKLLVLMVIVYLLDNYTFIQGRLLRVAWVAAAWLVAVPTVLLTLIVKTTVTHPALLVAKVILSWCTIYYLYHGICFVVYLFVMIDNLYMDLIRFFIATSELNGSHGEYTCTDDVEEIKLTYTDMKKMFWLGFAWTLLIRCVSDLTLLIFVIGFAFVFLVLTYLVLCVFESYLKLRPAINRFKNECCPYPIEIRNIGKFATSLPAILVHLFKTCSTLNGANGEATNSDDVDHAERKRAHKEAKNKRYRRKTDNRREWEESKCDTPPSSSSSDSGSTVPSNNEDEVPDQKEVVDLFYYIDMAPVYYIAKYLFIFMNMYCNLVKALRGFCGLPPDNLSADLSAMFFQLYANLTDLEYTRMRQNQFDTGRVLEPIIDTCFTGYSALYLNEIVESGYTMVTRGIEINMVHIDKLRKEYGGSTVTNHTFNNCMYTLRDTGLTPQEMRDHCTYFVNRLSEDNVHSRMSSRATTIATK